MKEPQVPAPSIDPGALIAPGAHIYGQVLLAERVFVLFGAVIRAELDRIEIGAESNVQDNAVLHCDEGIPCLVGERVTIGHSAVVHGAIRSHPPHLVSILAARFHTPCATQVQQMDGDTNSEAAGSSEDSTHPAT